MTTATKLTLAVLALMTATAATAQGQTNNASITATANVQTPINVVGAQGLNFGNVFPGLNKTVAASDATNAGRYDVTGQASANVNLTFVLPANLTSGGNLLPIGTWTGIHNTTNSPAGGTGFTPSSSPTAAVLSGTGQLFVWVGATVTPASNQAQGTYTAPVQMTVVYF